MYVRSFACGSPPELVTVNEWQQLSRRTLSATLTTCMCVCMCVCVSVCVCVSERERFRRSCNQSSLTGDALPSSLLSSPPQPLASFQFPPLGSLVLLVHDSPCGFLIPRRSGKQQNSVVVTRRLTLQGKERAVEKERESETDQSITLIQRRGLGEESRGNCGVFPSCSGLQGDIL